MRAVAFAAAAAWAGLLARSPDAPAENEALESVATRTRVALETLISDAQEKVRACQEGCSKDESQKLAAQLHRYQTALEQLSEYGNTTVMDELRASRTVEAKASKRVANLRAVLSGTAYAEDMLEKQEEFLTQQLAQTKADEKTTIQSLGQAERGLLAAQSDVQDKMNAAEVWATEIRSIERAAQLGTNMPRRCMRPGSRSIRKRRRKRREPRTSSGARTNSPTKLTRASAPRALCTKRRRSRAALDGAPSNCRTVRRSRTSRSPKKSSTPLRSSP
jgi:hypothetical protein